PLSGLVAERGMAAPVAQRQGELAQRVGQDQVVVAEADCNPVVGGGGVGGGEPDYPGERLAVEEGEQPGDAQLDGDRLVVEEPFDERPALVVCDWGGGASLRGEGDVQVA